MLVLSSFFVLLGISYQPARVDSINILYTLIVTAVNL
jgi:hypothetical protein